MWLRLPMRTIIDKTCGAPSCTATTPAARTRSEAVWFSCMGHHLENRADGGVDSIRHLWREAHPLERRTFHPDDDEVIGQPAECLAERHCIRQPETMTRRRRKRRWERVTTDVEHRDLSWRGGTLGGVDDDHQVGETPRIDDVERVIHRAHRDAGERARYSRNDDADTIVTAIGVPNADDDGIVTHDPPRRGGSVPSRRCRDRSS